MEQPETQAFLYERGEWCIRGKAKRMFLVDGEPVIAVTLGIIFEHAGFDSTSYHDPLELLAAVKCLPKMQSSPM